MIIGCDIDNTICEDAFAKKVLECKPYVFIENVRYFITARSINKRSDTIEWLRLNNYGIEGKDFELIQWPVKKSPRQSDAAIWKAELINKLGIDRYYDDSPTVVNYLRDNTKAEIIKWSGKKELRLRESAS